MENHLIILKKAEFNKTNLNTSLYLLFELKTTLVLYRPLNSNIIKKRPEIVTYFYWHYKIISLVEINWKEEYK